MPAAHTPQLRLAEVVAALSLATDLGMGQPMEQALRNGRVLTLPGGHACHLENMDRFLEELTRHITLGPQ